MAQSLIPKRFSELYLFNNDFTQTTNNAANPKNKCAKCKPVIAYK